MWVSTDYLLWWTRGMGIPPLVTASATGTPRPAAGVLGDPRTTVLYGDQNIDDDLRSGFRLRAGYWLDCCQTCGIDAGFFFLGDARDNFAANNGIISRPFYNIVDGREDSELVTYPGLLTGIVSVDSSTTFNGFDANFRKNVSCNCCSRIDALVGFRYLRLEDEVSINEDLTVSGTDPGRTNIPIGTRFGVHDSFTTRNEFYGANVGLTGERRSGCYFVNWRGTIAFGTVHKTASIEGSTTITNPGGTPVTYPGGLLALPTNMGHYSRNDFCVVPEVGFNVGYQFTENVRVYAGYSFLYMSNVTRVGDIIDTTVNPTQLAPGTLVGPARPAFSWHDSDFWAQGFNIGAELRY